jgi:hypothetical protein
MWNYSHRFQSSFHHRIVQYLCTKQKQCTVRAVGTNEIDHLPAVLLSPHEVAQTDSPLVVMLQYHPSGKKHLRVFSGGKTYMQWCSYSGNRRRFCDYHHRILLLWNKPLDAKQRNKGRYLLGSTWPLIRHPWACTTCTKDKHAIVNATKTTTRAWNRIGKKQWRGEI